MARGVQWLCCGQSLACADEASGRVVWIPLSITQVPQTARASRVQEASTSCLQCGPFGLPVGAGGERLSSSDRQHQEGPLVSFSVATIH